MKAIRISTFSIFWTLMLILFFQNYSRGQIPISQQKQILQNPPPASVGLLKILSNEIDIKNVETQPVNPKAQVDGILRYYNKKREENQKIQEVLKVSNDIVRKSISLASNFTGPLGKLVGGTVKYAASWGLDKVESAVENNLKTKNLNILSFALKEYKRKNGPTQLSELSEKNPKDIHKILVSGKYLPNMEPSPETDNDGRIILMGHQINELAKGQQYISGVLVKHGEKLVAQGYKLEEQEKEIGEIKTDLQNVWKDIGGMKNRLAKVETGMKEINKTIDEMQNHVGQNSDDIAYLQSFLYGKMTPEERKNALKNGFFGDLKDEERKELYEKANLEEKREQVLKDMQDFIEGGKHVYNIAGNLGLLKGEDLEDLGTVLDIGQNLFSASVGISQGGMGYLQAASSFSNIIGGFGKKKDDVAAKRHQQLVNLLKNVLGNQKVMIQKLDKLLEGQEQIIKNQIITYNSIIELSDKIDEKFDKVMDKLNDIDRNIFRSMEMLKDKDNPRIFCQSLFDDMVAFEVNHGVKMLDSGYKSIKEYYELERRTDYCPPCLKGISNLIRVSIKNDIYFDLYTYLKEVESNKILNKRINYWKEYHSFLYKVFERKVLNTSFNNAYAISLNPITSFNLIEKTSVKLHNAMNHKIPYRRYDKIRYRFDNSLLINKYASIGTIEIIDEFYRLLPFYEIVDSESDYRKLKSFNSIIKSAEQGMNEVTRDNINDAMIRLDIMIAQEVFLSGSNLLPVFYEIYHSDKYPDLRKEFIEKIIPHNPVLATNFVHYSLRKKILKNGYNAFDYHHAIANVTPEALDEIVKDKPNWGFTLDKKTKVWKAEIGKSKITLPKSKFLLEGYLKYNYSILDALELRKNLREYRDSGEFIRDMPYKQLLMRTLVKNR